jgi:hypothetical protein
VGNVLKLAATFLILLLSCESHAFLTRPIVTTAIVSPAIKDLAESWKKLNAPEIQNMGVKSFVVERKSERDSWSGIVSRAMTNQFTRINYLESIEVAHLNKEIMRAILLDILVRANWFEPTPEQKQIWLDVMSEKMMALNGLDVEIYTGYITGAPQVDFAIFAVVDLKSNQIISLFGGTSR